MQSEVQPVQDGRQWVVAPTARPLSCSSRPRAQRDPRGRGGKWSRTDPIMTVTGLDLMDTSALPGIFGTRAPPRRPHPPVAHLVSPPPSLYAGPAGPGRPLGLLGSPARAGFKDSSRGPQPLAAGPRRTGTRRPHAQVQPSEPPEEGRESGTLPC